MSGRDVFKLLGLLTVILASACDDGLIEPPLAAAIDSRDIGAVRSALADGADPNGVYESASMVTRSVWTGDPEMVRLLVRNGARVYGDARDGLAWFSITDPEELATLPSPFPQFQMAATLLEIGYSPCARLESLSPANQLRDAATTEAEIEIAKRARAAEARCQ